MTNSQQSLFNETGRFNFDKIASAGKLAIARRPLEIIAKQIEDEIRYEMQKNYTYRDNGNSITITLDAKDSHATDTVDNSFNVGLEFAPDTTE